APGTGPADERPVALAGNGQGSTMHERGASRLADDNIGSTPVENSATGSSRAGSRWTPKPVNRNVVLAVLVSGAFVIILNQTLLNTALPAFMADFGITANSAQWVTTIFMLVNGIMIPVTAFLIQKFTTRALFLTAMGLFCVGTL